MYNQLLKIFLDITDNPSAIVKFILVYCLVWLLWHNHLLLTLMISSGGVIDRVHQALTSVEKYQPFSVFTFTVFLYLVRIFFQYFVNLSRAHIDKQEQAENSPFSVDSDVEQLLETLDAYREKLAASEEREKFAKQESKDSIHKVLLLQGQLEESIADNQILEAKIKKLEDKLSLITSR